MRAVPVLRHLARLPHLPPHHRTARLPRHTRPRHAPRPAHLPAHDQHAARTHKRPEATERPGTARRTRAVRLLTAALGLCLPLVLVPAGTSTAAPGAVSTAAGLERVTGFGSNPGALSMYRYVPADLPAGRPVVVVLHGCTQNAAGYFDGAGWQRMADTRGFAVVAPQQEMANNLNKCFNWFQPGDTARGRGEALSIAQMVDRTVTDLAADGSRVFVTGLSAGGAMTASLLAGYPDVFAAGAVIGGLPHDCARTVLEAFGCMNPGTDRSPSAWGDRVRAAAPGHTGPRPRVSVWHGTADTTVVPANATESVEQWTDVLGADQAADAVTELPGNATRSDFTDGSGRLAVRSYLVRGMGHGTPVAPGEGCGRAGTYFPDTLCSTAHIAEDWGLTG